MSRAEHDRADQIRAELARQGIAVGEDDIAVMGVNVRDLFHACQAVYPFMRRQHKGRIINIASISARKGMVRRTSYSASKSAVVALMCGLAVEWAADGITVNAISPGSMASPDRPADSTSARYKMTIDLIPLGLGVATGGHGEVMRVSGIRRVRLPNRPGHPDRRWVVARHASNVYALSTGTVYSTTHPIGGGPCS